MNKAAHAISLIIPVYNEEKNIDILLKTLGEYVSTIDSTMEIVFVDDGSTDNSFELLKKARHVGYKSKILKLSKNYGSHSALRAGIFHSEGQFITFISADLQDPLEVIGELYEKINEGYDIVLAARDDSRTNFQKKILSRLYAYLIRQFIFPHFPKSNFDMVMFNDKVGKELNKYIETHSSLFLQIIDLGFKQTTISYTKKQRVSGRSKWTFGKKLKLLVDTFVAFSYVPIRFISIIGILLAVSGILWAFYVIVRAFILKDIQSGWPTLISVLMFGFGITNISLGIIAEYLWRTFDVSRNKPTFIISEIVSLNQSK